MDKRLIIYVRIYIDKIENRIAFKTKTGNYLVLLISEIMKLLGSSKSKITKDECSENVPHLEIQQQLSARFKSIIYIYS